MVSGVCDRNSNTSKANHRNDSYALNNIQLLSDESFAELVL